MLKTSFSNVEVEIAFNALGRQLQHFPLTRESGLKEIASADEFMLMQQGPCGESQEDWYAFKHSHSRNYVYVRVRDERFWVPVNPAPSCFHRGVF